MYSVVFIKVVIETISEVFKKTSPKGTVTVPNNDRKLVTQLD